ncbi:MAG: Wzz/FepE/Etk N-terminal domain-containing protein [Solirubrobacteraceae bacterium]
MEQYIGTLRRHVLLIAFVAVAMTVVAYTVTAAQPPKYQATSELLVNQAPAAALPDFAGSHATDALTLQRQVSTQLQLGNIPAIARAALRDANVQGITPTQLLSQVSLASKPDADVVTVTITASSADLAERLSTSYARAFSNYDQVLLTNTLAQQAKLLDGSIAAQLKADPALANSVRNHRPISPQSVYSQLVSARNDVIAASAEVPTSSTVVSSAASAVQTAPKPTRNAALALALGLLLGCGLAFLIDALGKRAHTTLEVGEELRLPLLARVPAPRRPPGHLRWSARNANAALTMLTDPGSPHAEAIKMLQANLELARLNHASTVVLCTSAVSREGKSTTIVNLAVSLAQAGRDVVLVDADLRRPTLAQMFGLSATPGLSELALGAQASLTEVPLESLSASPIVRGRLRLLPAGIAVEQPDRLLSSDALAAFFGRLRSDADFVLVDSPPMTEVYDSLIVSRHVDALIAVARVGHVKVPTLAEFARLLSTTSVLPLGYVATGVKTGDVNRYESSRTPLSSVQGDGATDERTGASR